MGSQAVKLCINIKDLFHKISAMKKYEWLFYSTIKVNLTCTDFNCTQIKLNCSCMLISRECILPVNKSMQQGETGCLGRIKYTNWNTYTLLLS